MRHLDQAAAAGPVAGRADQVVVGRSSEGPVLPAQITFGPGSAAHLTELLDADPVATGSRRPILVFGQAAAQHQWAADLFDQLHRRFGTGLMVASRRGDRLTVQEADRLSVVARDHSPDLVIGVGGGSVLDAAKVVAALASGPLSVVDAASRSSDLGPVLPVVAVPTTPGSGSEATPTATVWDEAAGLKLALDHPLLLPRVAVVDPLLSRSLPSPALAAAALDGLAHGVESAWATASTPRSTAHALTCVALISSQVLRCLADRDDMSALSAVSLGATHGGVAIATTRTTLAHALSYPLSLRHGLRHGHACALMLGAVAQFNAEVVAADCDDHRGPDFVHAALSSVLASMGVRSVAGLELLLGEICEAGGLGRYEDVADALDLAATMAESARYNRARNNPRRYQSAALLPLINVRSRD